MIIIDKFDPPPPIFIYQEVPTFRTAYEKQKFWAEEDRRCIEGYESLPGMLYWYATRAWLKQRNYGTIFRPTVRDADLLIFSELDDCWKKGESPFIIKGRGVGLSSIGMNLPLYFGWRYPNSTSVATSKDKGTLAMLFREKTAITFEEMRQRDITEPPRAADAHPYYIPKIVRKNQTSKESFLSYAYQYTDDKDHLRVATNEFYCRDTQESDRAATNFSGAGAIYGFADEAPLMPRFQLFHDSAREIFMDHENNRMAGLFFFGGTCEDSLDANAIAKVANVWNNAEAMRIRPIFIPATYGKHLVNGHSNHARAREENLRERELKDKMQDKAAVRAHIRNNPLSIDEIFELGKGGLWEEDAQQILIDQQKKIDIERPPVAKYVVVSTGVGSAEVKNNSAGSIEMLEGPREGVKYIIGVDGTGTSEMSSEDGKSEIAAVCMKGFDPGGMSYAPVSIYSERPKTIEASYRKILNVAIHYNRYGLCQIMAEGNLGTAEHFAAFLIKEGYGHFIIYGKDLSGKGNVSKNKIWVYVTDGVREWQQRQGNVHIRRYGQNIWFKRLAENLLLPATTNADLRDAYYMCLVGFGADFDKPAKTKPKQKRMEAYYEFDAVKGYEVKWREV